MPPGTGGQVTVCGQNPRDGSGWFLAGAHFHLDGEGERKVDGATGPEKRLLAGHDPECIEPQAGLSPDPVDVVRGPESKRPQAREEQSQGEGKAGEGEKSTIGGTMVTGHSRNRIIYR